MRPVVAVTGTRREAAALRGLGMTVLAGGGDPEWLAAELARMAGNAAGIISFGMAGALDSKLVLGDLVIGAEIVGGGGKCDAAWVRSLKASLPGASTGPVYADGRLIADPDEKRRIGADTGAVTADMESHIAARAAAEAGVPFAILRCISDEAQSALPPAIAVAMRPGGALDIGAILRSILQKPVQIPDLIATTMQFKRAFASLRNGAAQTGSRLAFDRR